MDALELLMRDHWKIKELFAHCRVTTDTKKLGQLFREIKAELELHTYIEETIFYPAMEKYEEIKSLVLESIEEHRQLKMILRELARLFPSSERFKPRLKVLMDDFEHHAEEEEEGKMFYKIIRLVDNAELDDLGEEIERVKHKRFRKAS